MPKDTKMNIVTITLFFLLYLVSKLMTGDSRTELIGMILEYTSVTIMAISGILIPFKKSIYYWFHPIGQNTEGIRT